MVLSDDPDFEYALVDGTIVKVHRHGVERPLLKRTHSALIRR